MEGALKVRLRAGRITLPLLYLYLLGQPPSVPDQDLEVPTIHTLPQDSRVGLFSKGKLVESRMEIKEGKACGDGGIAPEFLTRVDVDNLILEFCNPGSMAENQHRSSAEERELHLNI
jgi:hypothetical protein